MSSNSLTYYFPPELHYYLLTLVDVASLVTVRSLNTYWREMADIDALWKKFVAELCPEALKYHSADLDYKVIYSELVSLGFNPNACGRNIDVSQDHFTAVKSDDHKYATVLSNKKLTPETAEGGRHYWEVTVSNMQLSGCLCVGVVNDKNAVNCPSESHGMFGHYAHGWGLFSDGERCHNATWYRPAYSSFTTGDTVGVLVEFVDDVQEPDAKVRSTDHSSTEKTATISFFINKVPQGVAFKGVKGPLYPSFAIKRKGEGVKLNVAATLEFLLAEKQRAKQIVFNQKHHHVQAAVHKEIQVATTQTPLAANCQ